MTEAATDEGKANAGLIEKWAREDMQGLAETAEGGRNDVLNKLAYRAGQFVRDGLLIEDKIVALLAGPARQCGLPDGEIQATIASGMRGGKASVPTERDHERTAASDLPSPFVRRRGWIGYDQETEDAEVGAETPRAEAFVKACSDLKFKLRAREQSGIGYYKVIEVTQPDGSTREFVVPDQLAADTKALVSFLLERGVKIGSTNKARAAVVRLFMEVEPPKDCLATARLGWYDDLRRYVLPDRVIGTSTDEPVIYTGSTKHGIAAKGTLTDWQTNVAARCFHDPANGGKLFWNSCLVLAIGVALVGPVLRLLGEQGTTFHLHGASSTGKSTALHMGQSVWGHTPMLPTWRGTDNGIEARALASNDGLMILDEVHQAESAVVANTAYMLSNGRGKDRARQDGSSRAAAEWQVSVLSSGEVSAETAIERPKFGKSTPMTAGQSVRMIDVPADAGTGNGIFDVVPTGTAREMAEEIKGAVSEAYGTAGPALVKHLIDDRTGALARIKADVQKFNTSVNRKYGSEPQAARVVGRFALIYAVIREAAKAGVLPKEFHNGAASVFKCVDAWRKARGSTKDSEPQKAIERVEAFLAAHRSRFLSATNEPTPRDLAGYHEVEKGGGASIYRVLPKAFKEILDGISVSVATKALLDAGILTRGGSTSDPRMLTKYRWPGELPTNVYVLRYAGHGGDQ